MRPFHNDHTSRRRQTRRHALDLRRYAPLRASQIFFRRRARLRKKSSASRGAIFFLLRARAQEARRGRAASTTLLYRKSSSAKLSLSTLTRDSPKKPALGELVASFTMAVTFASSR